MKCPHCNKTIADELIAAHLAKKGGKAKSEAKTKAARENAKKPRKRKPKV